MTFLTLMGAIDGHAPTEYKKQRVVYAFDIHKTKTNFRPTRSFRDFEFLPKGELIGSDGRHKVLALEDMLIIFARKLDQPGKEAFILARYE